MNFWGFFVGWIFLPLVWKIILCKLKVSKEQNYSFIKPQQIFSFCQTQIFRWEEKPLEMSYCSLWTAIVHIFLIWWHQIIFVFSSGVICQYGTMSWAMGQDLYWPFETNPVCLGKTSHDGLRPYLTRTSFH